jgi:DNA-binding NtrC family response regulator
MDVLCTHDWPGNVRELENAVERAAALCEGDTIQAADLPPSILEAVKFSDSGKEPDAGLALPTVPDSALYPLRSNESGELGAGSAPASSAPVMPLKTFMRDQEQSHLNRALQQCGGDKEKAAVLLGVSLATLYRKLSGEEKES